MMQRPSTETVPSHKAACSTISAALTKHDAVYRASGVADGVGGWIEQGVDAGEYSRSLMENAHSYYKQNYGGGANAVVPVDAMK
jgi:hypothetical protein